MAFERFTGAGKSYKPKISIRGNGQIGLNLGAVKRFKLDQYGYAVLFYDREHNKIGIKPTNDPEEGAAKLNVRESSAAISAKAFLDYYEIKYGDEVEKMDAYWDESLGMIVAEPNSEYMRQLNHEQSTNKTHLI